MIHHLHKLRQRPNHEKKRIAFLVSAGVTVTIFLFWVASFGGVTTTSETGVASVISPFDAVKSNVASVYDSFVKGGDAFNKAFNKNEQTIEVVSGGDKVNSQSAVTGGNTTK